MGTHIENSGRKHTKVFTLVVLEVRGFGECSLSMLFVAVPF